MVVLDERLSAAAQMIRPGSRVADVGTDHGYLIARLLLDGKAAFGYACDIHPNPLEKAAKTLRQYDLQDRCALLLGDGLQGLSEEQVDDVVIAGMGGDMILHILDEAGWRNPAHRFVLQPMTKIHELRIGLYQRGYEILKEQAAQVKNFAYTVMQVRWCGQPREITDLFARVGMLPQTRSAAALVYLEKQAQSAEKIAEGLEKSNTKRNEIDKYYELAKEIRAICADWREEE